MEPKPANAANDTAMGTAPQPFSHVREHLALHLERVRLLTLRYMRRFAFRVVKGTHYSDQYVGKEELRFLAGDTNQESGDTWLDQQGVPSLAAIEENLAQVNDHIVARLRATRDSACIALPLEELRAGFMLNESEMDLLLCAAAPRLSVDLSRLFAVAYGDFSLRQPSAAFLADLVGNGGDEEGPMAMLTDHAPLVQYRLLIANEVELWRPMTPRLHAAIGVPQRILDFISGTLHDEAGLTGCALHRDGLALEDLVLDEETRSALRAMLSRARARICLVGPVASGRRTIVRAFAARAGTRVLEVELCRAITAIVANDMLVELAEILREARLHHAVLLLRLDGLAEHPVKDLIQAQAPIVQRLLRNYPGPIFVVSTAAGKLVRTTIGEIAEITIGAPNKEGQQSLWRRALAAAMPLKRADKLAEELSRSYRLPPGAIFRAVEHAVEQADARVNKRAKGLDAGHLLRMVRRQFDHGLGWLADAISVNMGLDDVVLSADMRRQIHEILVFARHADKVFHSWRFADRSPTGQGLSVLFSGPPGTGKTLLAGVLARELGRVLYRVDLSRIVDKYIGETEKNLGRVFDEAERAQAVLLFDEADSLFAQRTKVKSSNDRYANLEVNYLLQRLDGYEGVSILTTNFVTNIDEAFQRRIRFKIEFPLPDVQQRALLWQALLPPEAPLDERIDWFRLADNFEFSGGHIRNAVLRAAVHAAERASAIAEEMLFDAATAESREMGQLVRRDEPDDAGRAPTPPPNLRNGAGQVVK